MISNIPQVEYVDFISREEALRNMADMFNPRLMAGFELRNPLRDSFAITLVDLAYQEDAIRLLEQLEPYGVANIRADERGAGILRQVTFVVQIVSGTLILMLGIVSTIIITNTIRITVNARRTEINIMKYVGATDWFIRWPFIIEGILIGMIGGLIPVAACWFGYPYVVELLQEFFGYMLLLPSESIFAYLFPFAMLMGILIGIIGSGVSLRRHLNV
jgi:cell division transport system permease protein